LLKVGGSLRERYAFGLQQTLGNQAVQRLVNQSRATAPAEDDLAQRIETASAGGNPLDTAARERLQASMGVDLSGVRVHLDEEADRLAESVESVAFTTGNDIFFRSGMYQPETPTGFHLLAHEVTHTLQQARGPVSGTWSGGNVSISDPQDQFEQAAEQAADSVLFERHPVIAPSIANAPTAMSVQRQGDEYEIPGWRLNSLREAAREGAYEDLVESVESGTYSPQSMYTAERFTPDQLVEFAETGEIPEGMEFSHLYSAAEYPEVAGNSELGVLTDNWDHFYGHHGGNYANNPNGSPLDPDWESTEFQGDQGIQEVEPDAAWETIDRNDTAEQWLRENDPNYVESEAEDYLGGTESSEVASEGIESSEAAEALEGAEALESAEVLEGAEGLELLEGAEAVAELGGAGTAGAGGLTALAAPAAAVAGAGLMGWQAGSWLSENTSAGETSEGTWGLMDRGLTGAAQAMGIMDEGGNRSALLSATEWASDHPVAAALTAPLWAPAALASGVVAGGAGLVSGVADLGGEAIDWVSDLF
jgi:hypothetical protein